MSESALPSRQTSRWDGPQEPSRITWELREPLSGDAEGFAALHSRVWRTTYRGIMPDEVVDVLEPGQFRPTWDQVVAAYDAGAVAKDGRGFLVALQEGTPVGFCMHGPARDEDPPTPHQLWSLNVAPDHQGSGVAQQLVDLALGRREAYLWVARGNDRAIRFYARQGFALDGTQSLDGHEGVVELRMVRAASLGT
ncbi:GNAT family N-acetyltransferase [Serinicoccus kebangsaanensis]|uniref:GNAT family N-acetyltransferase n=1 Tax=Serinicoccus kebangsaanensis TaxID=2602069 RepID=UPI00124CA28F|nr:GNAT family N-acetyltransferase [Serinicoccus kebangsaanensis]